EAAPAGSPAQKLFGFIGANAAVGTKSEVGMNRSPLADSVGNRYRFGLAAKAEHSAYRLGRRLHARLAIFSKEERAGCCFLHRQGIEIGQVVNVDVGPDIQSVADIPTNAAFSGGSDQIWDLKTLW